MAAHRPCPHGRAWQHRALCAQGMTVEVCLVHGFGESGGGGTTQRCLTAALPGGIGSDQGAGCQTPWGFGKTQYQTR